MHLYIELEEDIKFFLRHVVAQWLTMGPTIYRMLKHSPALEKFVLEVLPKKSKSSCNTDMYKKLKSFFFSPAENHCKLLFAYYMAKQHKRFCLKFQADKPLAHFLPKEAFSLFTTVMNTYNCSPQKDSSNYG